MFSKYTYNLNNQKNNYHLNSLNKYILFSQPITMTGNTSKYYLTSFQISFKWLHINYGCLIIPLLLNTHSWDFELRKASKIPRESININSWQLPVKKTAF